MRLLIAFAALSLVLVASAIEAPKPAAPPDPSAAKEEPAKPPPPAAPEEPATSEQAKPQAGAPPAEDEEEETLPPLPADAVPAGPPPARFNPTEKVRADFPVSFPIDI